MACFTDTTTKACEDARHSRALPLPWLTSMIVIMVTPNLDLERHSHICYMSCEEDMRSH